MITPVEAQDLVKDYALRWGIETLFSIFKTRGFRLESTHFTEFGERREVKLKPAQCRAT